MKATFQASIVRGVIVPHPAYAGAVAAKLARFKPGTLTVTVESEVKRRTLSQNRRMWGILSAFEELGWERDEAKTWCCAKFLDPIVR